MVTVNVTPPSHPLPTTTATLLCDRLRDWQMIDGPDGYPTSQDLWEQVLALEAAHIPVRWLSRFNARADPTPTVDWQQTKTGYAWPDSPTILALIPHWGCESWLKRCLTSLKHQTYPLTHMVVIDDASLQPPLEMIQAVPDVTLLTSPQRVGPYRLIQSVIDATDYDAYLFQDADDWSTCDRIQTLLQTARLSGAELVGCQEIRVMEPTPATRERQLQAVGYPLDVNRALADSPGHPLLHPTSLVTRHLVQRVGGFATGLRFGGDTEFLLRAHWVGRIVNSGRYCYFRRKRPGSLTTAKATGLESPTREKLIQAMKQRAIAHSQAATQKQALDLRPLATAPPISLTHLWGPELQWSR